MVDYSFKELGFFLASGISRFHGSKFHHSASVCSMLYVLTQTLNLCLQFKD